MTTRLLVCFLLAALVVGCGQRTESPRKIKTDGEAKKDDSSPKKDKDNREDKKPTTPVAGEITDKDPEPNRKADKLDVPPDVEMPQPGMSSTNEPGVIRGRVCWEGPMPAPAEGEHYITVGGREMLIPPSPVFVVDPETNGLANVMVWLASAPAGAKAPETGDAKLRQSRGTFRPRAQFAHKDDRLVLTTTEEVDFRGAGLRFARFVSPGKCGQVMLHRLGLTTIQSDERPWMLPAYVRVLDHGYCAVTGKDGKFELPPVPPGEYEVLLWPAGYQREGRNVRQRVKVVLAEGKGATINWVASQLQ